MRLLPALLLLLACSGKNDTGDTSEVDTDDDSTPADTDTAEETDTGEDATVTDVTFEFSAAEISTKDVLAITAMASWSDGSSTDVSAETTCTSSDEAVLKFYTPGQGQPLAAGSAHLTVSYDSYSDEGDVAVTLALVAPGDLVINEILVDPPVDTNGDGVYESGEDEFLEIANHADATIDLSGVTISETDIPELPRHTFAEGTVLQAGEAVLVYGGGSVDSLAFSHVLAFVATNDDSSLEYGLALNNEGDRVTLWMPDGATAIADMPYGDEGTNEALEDASLVLDPDVWGTSYTHHHYADGALADYSPGTYVDGSAFPGPEGRYAP